MGKPRDAEFVSLLEDLDQRDEQSKFWRDFFGTEVKAADETPELHPITLEFRNSKHEQAYRVHEVVQLRNALLTTALIVFIGVGAPIISALRGPAGVQRSLYRGVVSGIYLVFFIVMFAFRPRGEAELNIKMWKLYRGLFMIMCCSCYLFVNTIRYVGTNELEPYVPQGDTALLVIMGVLSITKLHIKTLFMLWVPIPVLLHLVGDNVMASTDDRYDVINLNSLLIITALCLLLVVTYMQQRMWRNTFRFALIVGQEETNLAVELRKSQVLLENVLPQNVVNKLQTGTKSIAEEHPDVSVLFADLVGFTTLSQRLDAEDMVAVLNNVFTKFDQFVEDRGLTKIKTIGDCYMCVAGIDDANASVEVQMRNQDKNHGEIIVEFGFFIHAVMVDINRAFGTNLQFRIGVNTGSVVGGVIGSSKYIYDCWGTTVNCASRMESNGEAGRIQVTETTKEKIIHSFTVTEERMVDVKGIGKVKAFYVEPPQSIQTMLSSLRSQGANNNVPSSVPTSLLGASKSGGTRLSYANLDLKMQADAIAKEQQEATTKASDSNNHHQQPGKEQEQEQDEQQQEQQQQQQQQSEPNHHHGDNDNDEHSPLMQSSEQPEQQDDADDDGGADMDDTPVVVPGSEVQAQDAVAHILQDETETDQAMHKQGEEEEEYKGGETLHPNAVPPSKSAVSVTVESIGGSSAASEEAEVARARLRTLRHYEARRQESVSAMVRDQHRLVSSTSGNVATISRGGSGIALTESQSGLNTDHTLSGAVTPLPYEVSEKLSTLPSGRKWSQTGSLRLTARGLELEPSESLQALGAGTKLDRILTVKPHKITQRFNDPELEASYLEQQHSKVGNYRLSIAFVLLMSVEVAIYGHVVLVTRGLIDAMDAWLGVAFVYVVALLCFLLSFSKQILQVLFEYTGAVLTFALLAQSMYMYRSLSANEVVAMLEPGHQGAIYGRGLFVTLVVFVSSYALMFLRMRFLLSVAVMFVTAVVAVIMQAPYEFISITNLTSAFTALLVVGAASYVNEASSRRTFLVHTEANVRASLTQAEAGKAEAMLLNILPETIIEEVKGSKHKARLFPGTTVMFADIVDFTAFAKDDIDAETLVAVLNDMYTRMDQMTLDRGVEKIKTIGDAYMCAAGCPIPQEDHAERVVELAFKFIEIVGNMRRPDGKRLEIRVGVNSGATVGGVIGTTKFAYDLWGDTVNTAARMEAFGFAGKVHCTAATKELLEGKYLFESCGVREIKGKGNMETFIITGPVTPQ